MQARWIPFLPPSASTLSDRVDALYLYLVGITSFFTLLITGVLLFFMVRYRRRSPHEIPRPIAGSHKYNWLTGSSSQQSPALMGQQLYQTLGCVSCHGAGGEGGRGPTLAGLSGRRVFLKNRGSISVDEAYIRESIVDPRAKIVEGFGPIMPTFQGQLTEEQLLQIIAFIKSLQGQIRHDAESRQPGD